MPRPYIKHGRSVGKSLDHYVPHKTALHRVGAVWLAAHETSWPAVLHRRRRACLDVLCAVMGLIEVERIAWEDVVKFVKHRRRQEISPIIIGVELKTLTLLLEWCQRYGIVGDVATHGLRVRDIDPQWQSSPLHKLARIHLEVINANRR